MQSSYRHPDRSEKSSQYGVIWRRFLRLFSIGFQIIRREGWKNFWAIFRIWLVQKFFRNTSIFSPNLYRLQLSDHTLNQVVPTTNQDFLTDREKLPEIDIVVVTLNSEKYIRNLIASIETSSYPLNLLHIIIIDNHSSDGTLNILNEISNGSHNFKRFQTIFIDYNPGYGTAINKAVKQGEAPYIFVTNPDVELDPNCLSELVQKAARDNDAWLWEPRQFPYEHPKYYDPLSFETMWSSGAGFLMQRNKFEEIGGFDEFIFLYTDDVDISLRIWNAGGRCRYVPNAVIWHFTYKEPYEIKPLQWFYSLKYNTYMRYKFGNPFEIIKGYILLGLVFLWGDKRIDNARWKILNIIFTHFNLIPKALSWRITKRKSFFNRFKFMDFDYEARRLGDYYNNRYCLEKPLVTIIVRTIQRPAYLKSAILSIVNQTYKPLEIIVIEDGQATSSSVIDQFSKIPGINFKYHSTGIRGGEAKAGNEGLKLASGIFINFLDDDDLIYADHIEVLVNALLSNKLKYKAAYAASFKVEAIYTKERILRKNFRHFFCHYSKKELEIRNIFPVQSVLFHRSLYDLQGGLDEKLEVLDDWDSWLRYSKITDYLEVKKTTSEFRIPADITKKESRQAKLDQAYSRVRQKNGLI